MDLNKLWDDQSESHARSINWNYSGQRFNDSILIGLHCEWVSTAKLADDCPACCNNVSQASNHDLSGPVSW